MIIVRIYSSVVKNIRVRNVHKSDLFHCENSCLGLCSNIFWCVVKASFFVPQYLCTKYRTFPLPFICMFCWHMVFIWTYGVDAFFKQRLYPFLSRGYHTNLIRLQTKHHSLFAIEVWLFEQNMSVAKGL